MRSGVLASALFSAVVAALTAVPSRAIVDDPYHHLSLSLVPNAKSSICLDTQSDSLYGVYQKTLYIGDGANYWRTVKAWSYPVKSIGRDTFVDSHGNVYVSLGGIGQLARGAYNGGGKRQWTYPVDFHCQDSNFWHMAEDADGNLYFGEYSSCAEPCECAFVWRSTDQGVTWACTDSIDSRHVHGIWTDATRETLYMSVGDGPPAPGQSLLYRSVNHGEDWELLHGGDLFAQPVSSVGTASGYQVWGGDFGPLAEPNRIYRSRGDDTTFETTCMPGDPAEDAYMWTMSRNGRGVLFCGTTVKQANVTHTSILRSADDGATWTRVLKLGISSSIFTGVLNMTSRFDGDRCGYFYDNTTSPAKLWRFRDASFSVGEGGDYATIAEALLHTAPRDTLILLPGTHDADACALHDDMTLRGATSDESLYRIRNADQEHAAIVVDSTSIVRSVTFCGLDGGGTRAGGAAGARDSCDAIVYSGSGGVVSGCAFRCGAGYAVRGPGKIISLTGNEFETCGDAVALVDGASYVAGNAFTGACRAIALSGGTFRGGGTLRALEPGASYHVLGDLRVGEPGSPRTLTIEPGTVLEFASGTGIQVGYWSTRGYYGKLSAIGTRARPIVIRPLSGLQGGWKGIYFPFGLTRGATLRNCRISAGGQAWEGRSANVIDACDFATPVVVDSCTIAMGSGCGIHSRWGAARITHSTIVANAGDGVYCEGGVLNVEGSIVTGSTSGYGVNGETATALLSCCDVWGNAAGNYGRTLEDQTGQNGNISEDPLFCDADGEDFSLHASSPCADMHGCGIMGAEGVGCGSCGAVEPWSFLASALPDPVMDHEAAVLGDFAYVSGGLLAGGRCTDRVDYLDLSVGRSGPWLVTRSLPDSLRDHCMVSAGDWLYVIGGGEGSAGTEGNPMLRTVRDEVWRASPDEHGLLSAWQSCSPLPGPLWGAGAAVWNGRVYVAGGCAGDSLLGAPSDRIYSTAVGPDGGLGPWTEDAVRLPEPATELGLLARDGRLWVVGGRSGGAERCVSSVVTSASILPDGALDSVWVTAAPLPEGRCAFGVACDSDGLAFVVGGENSSGMSARSVFWTILSQDGGCGDWQDCEGSIPPLPGEEGDCGLSHTACFMSGRRLCVAGGCGRADAPNDGCRNEVLQADIIPGGPTGVPDEEEWTGSWAADPAFGIRSVRPNPLARATSITYSVPAPGSAVSLRIYDLGGREVRTLVAGAIEEGVRHATWDGRTDDGTPAASGVYFCRLASGALRDSSKLVLLR